MAFLGYDPFRGVSNAGNVVAQVGQQIGGAISSIPRVQRENRLGLQQERLNEQSIQRNDLQIGTMKEVETQITQNPKIIAEIGRGLTNKLRKAIEGLSPELQKKYSAKIDVYESFWKSFENRTRVEPGEATSVIAKVQKDWGPLHESVRIAQVLQGNPNPETEQQLFKAFSELDPDISRKAVEGTTAFGAIPKSTELTAAQKLELAKRGIDLDIAKTKLEQLKIPKPKDDLAERKFKDLQVKGLRKAEEDLAADIAKADKAIAESQQIIDAGLNAQLPGGNITEKVTEDVLRSAQANIERLNSDRESLVTSMQARQSGFLESTLKPGESFGVQADGTQADGAPLGDLPVGDASKVGDFVGGWTKPTIKISQNRIGGLELTKKYDPIIKEASAKYGIPEEIIRSIMIQESYIEDKNGKWSLDPNAGSKAGAQGLMQLMPATAKELGVKNILDPRENIMGGTKYIAKQLKRFGNIETALSAYNAGPATTKKWLKKGSNYSKAKPETGKYVSMVRGYLEYFDSLKGPSPEEAVTSPVTGVAPGVDTLTEASGAVAPPVTSKKNRENSIRQVWDNSSLEDKKRILKRLDKTKYPDLLARFEREIIPELKEGTSF